MKTTKTQIVRNSILAMATALTLLATGCGASTPSQSSSQAPETAAATTATNTAQTATLSTFTSLFVKKAVPASIAAAPAVSKLTPQQETYSKLAAQKNQVNGVDYTFDIDRAWAAQVNPGIDTFGAPVFNEQELVTRLADGSANSNRAIAAFQEREIAKNGFTITRDEVLNAQNFQCVQMLKNNGFGAGEMASVTAKGTVNWSNEDFTDPAGSVSCAFVGPQVQQALAAGHSVVSIGFRGNCINVQEMPKIVKQVPTLPQTVKEHFVFRCDTVTKTDNVKLTDQQANNPRYVEVGNIACKPRPPSTIAVCIKGSGNQTLVPINQADFNPATMSTNPADCVKPPVTVLRCDSKTGTDNVPISEDTAKDTDRYKPVGDVACHPVEVIKACIKGSGDQTLRPVDKFDSKTMSTNPADCVKVEMIKVCIKGSGNQTLVPIEKKDFNPATQSTNPADCVKIETIKVCIRNSGDQTLVSINKQDFNPATMSTNIADCVKPFACQPGTFPNPSNPKDCLDSKDPRLSPPTAPGKDPGTATDDTKTPPVTPISNPINPTTPVTTPAPPVTQTPGATPTPTTPVSPVEIPAPTSTNKGTGITDPEQPTVAVSAAVPAAHVTAPAPVAKATPVVQAVAPVATTPAPATTAPAVHAAAPVGATSAPVATAMVAVAHVATAAAPAAHVGG